MAFKVSEKPERWLLGLRRLVVWSKDPEGMCVRATGVCGGLRALPPRPPALLQGFSCRGVLAQAGSLPQVRLPLPRQAGGNSWGPSFLPVWASLHSPELTVPVSGSGQGRGISEAGSCTTHSPHLQAGGCGPHTWAHHTRKCP